MRGKGFSTALFGWSQRLQLDGKEANWEEIFDECVKAGVDAVELSPARIDLTEQAQQRGLQVSAIYTSYPLHENGLLHKLKGEIVPLAERMASLPCTDLLINAVSKGTWAHPERKTEDELKAQGEVLSQMAEWVRPYGIKVCLHNHAKHLPQAMDDLRAVTDYSSPLVGLCVDTGWAYVSGMDPSAWIRSYPERIFALHLRNQRGETPTEDLTDGDIPMRTLVQELESIGYAGWVSMELWHRQDTKATCTMTEAVRRSIAWLRSCQGTENKTKG